MRRSALNAAAPSPVYPVALGMVLVVVSFAASLGWSHLLLRPVDDQALSILQSEIPSLQHLADMRFDLAHLGKNVRDFARDDGASRDQLGHAVSDAWERVESEFRQYRSLISSAEAAPLIAAVEQRLEVLEGATYQVTTLWRQHASAGQSPRFDAALEQADAAVGMLQRLNERQARDKASAILRARHQATIMATLLGNASVAIALIATLLVLRVLRARDRLTQENLRLLAERGAELEAFAGRVAHDLRDPLSAIALQVLAAARRCAPPPELARHLDAIDRQLERMYQVINALLDFARAGAAATAEGHADLAEVLGAVVAGLRPRLDSSQIELTVPEATHVQVACPPGVLSSVLANLMGNAAKYVVDGPQVPRRIAVRVEARPDTTHVEIEDNGPGIPDEAQELIFEPFQRVRGTRQPGFGLGLATVRKIIQAYHGMVGVRSRLGQGSVFWFELPTLQQNVHQTTH